MGSAARHDLSYRVLFMSSVISLACEIERYVQISESTQLLNRPNYFNDDPEFDMVSQLESNMFGIISVLTAQARTPRLANSLQILACDITDYAVSFMGLGGSQREAKVNLIRSLKSVKVNILRDVIKQTLPH